MDKKIEVALIGYGMSGQYFHLPPLLKSSQYHIKYVMTRNPKNIEKLNQVLQDVIIINSFDIVLTDHEIDLVIIATSNDAHAYYTKQAILAHKHVVCEKPFVETYAEAKSLFDLAHKNEVILRVFHNRRYDGDFLTVKELLQKKDFGQLLSFSARFDRFDPYGNDNWRFKMSHMPGAFYDLAPHLVHDAVELFGYPHQVYTKLYIDRLDGIVDDRFEMTLFYDTFECYLYSQVFDRDPRPRFEIIGTKATYVKYGWDQPDSIHEKSVEKYQTNQNRSELIYNDQSKDHIDLKLGEQYLFYQDLYEDIKNKSDKNNYKSLSLMVIQIMETGLKSNKENKILNLVKK